ncbi:MAG: hypothetical protein GX862_07485 [Leucobacter sp.]|nr:hypothetical protein [Leucobacter sp.]
MSTFVVASLTPGRLNIHGDAQNANVLAARAQWAGHQAEVVEIHSAADAAGLTPQAITIGSGFESDADEVRDALTSIADQLHGWVAADIPLLAVGLGWELLSESTQLSADESFTGLGVFSGRFVAGQRAVGPVALHSPWGELIGYEYHYRDYLLGPDEEALVRVLAGVGNLTNAQGTRSEGVVRGRSFGTTMRGPILARNPHLADEMLGDFRALASTNESQRLADEYAQRTNSRVRDGLGLA